MLKLSEQFKQTKIVKQSNFVYSTVQSFSSKHEFKLKLAGTFSHIAMDASSAQSVNILATFNTYQYFIYISAPTISTSLNFRDLVPVKGRLMCIAYVKHVSDDCASFARSVVTPRHRCVIMSKVVNFSLRKICHYQQNVPQHYYVLDTQVNYMYYITDLFFFV